jgi:kynurenine 3-monooxygenase
MLMAFANVDGSFTVALYLPLEGDCSFASLSSESDLAALFERAFPDALHHMPQLTHEFFERPTTNLGTVRCRPWVVDGAVALLGDAAHALVPFYGQGANFGFEDCAALDACLDETGDDWSAALARYDGRRRADGDIMAALAVAHLDHLQHAIDSENARRRQDVEQRLHELHPDAFMPLYSMIAFTTLSYAEAVRRHQSQRPVVDRVLSLCAGSARTDDVDAVIHAVLAEQGA